MLCVIIYHWALCFFNHTLQKSHKNDKGKPLEIKGRKATGAKTAMLCQPVTVLGFKAHPNHWVCFLLIL